MERLTTRCAGHAVMAWEHEEKHTTQEWIDLLTDRLAAYEDTGYTPKDFDRLCREMSDLRTALALPTYESLRDVIRRRRLVLLAVSPSMRPGCTSSFVYIIEDGEIFEDSVYEVILGEDDNRQLAVVYSTHEGIAFRQECFGKTVFLTEDQAKAALDTQQGAGK